MQVMETSSSLQQHSGETDDDDYGDYGDDEITTACDDWNVHKGSRFTDGTVAVLKSLYRKGMIGWGRKHADDIQAAIAGTGLKLDQVKVCFVKGYSGMHITLTG